SLSQGQTHQSLSQGQTHQSLSQGQTHQSLSQGQTHQSLSQGQTQTQFLEVHPPCLADLQISRLGPSLCHGSGHIADHKGPRFVGSSGLVAGLLIACVSAAGFRHLRTRVSP
ncbi:hypothetical protein AMECASPLE_027282, partial [Ameca splendens]